MTATAPAPTAQLDTPGAKLPKPAATAYDVAAYERGWRSSITYAQSTAYQVSTPLERADERGESGAWYDGYLDYAAGRSKWHLAWCGTEHAHCGEGRPTAPAVIPEPVDADAALDAVLTRKAHAATIEADPAGGYTVACPQGCPLGTSKHQPDLTAAGRRVALHWLTTAPLVGWQSTGERALAADQAAAHAQNSAAMAAVAPLTALSPEAHADLDATLRDLNRAYLAGELTTPEYHEAARDLRAAFGL